MVKLCGKETSTLSIVSLIATAALFIASLIVLIIGGITISYAGDVENLPNFAIANCTVSAVQVATLAGCAFNPNDYGPSYYDEWIAVWQCRETGASIVEDPFSSRFSPNSASRDRNDYPLNVSQVVMCNTVNPPVMYPNADHTRATGCQVWSTCFFDVDMVKYMQLNGVSDRQRGFVLLFTGIALLGISFVFCIVYLVSVWRAYSYVAV